MRDEPEGDTLTPTRPSDSVRLRAREFDSAIGIANLIVVSGPGPRQQPGHMTAPSDGE